MNHDSIGYHGFINSSRISNISSKVREYLSSDGLGTTRRLDCRVERKVNGISVSGDCCCCCGSCYRGRVFRIETSSSITSSFAPDLGLKEANNVDC